MTLACNSFEYTATGILGDKRLSMLRNELHLRVKAVVVCGFKWFVHVFIVHSTITQGERKSLY